MATLRTILAFVLLSLSVPALYRTDAQEGAVSELATAIPCDKTLTEINRLIDEALEEYSTVVINCLSFDGEEALRNAIVSGYSDSAENRRFEFVCRSGVLVGFPSNESVTETEYGGCLQCTDEADPCSEECVSNPNPGSSPGSSPGMSCPADCERCYSVASNCTRCCSCMFGDPIENCTCDCFTGFTGRQCDDCDGVINLNSYPVASSIPESLEDAEMLRLGEEGPNLEDATCNQQCREPHHEAVAEEDSPVHDYCFACGIEYCVECDVEANECRECISRSVEFEHECFVGQQALIAVVAHEQEEEVEAEERDKEQAGLALAVALPIVCVGIIIFFVGMAIFAHYRYPHVSHRGQKRHRRQRAETQPPPVHEQVWRARPTIRLR